MRVLYIPSWYPSSKNMNAGRFIEQLANDIASEDCQVELTALHQNFRSFSNASYTKKVKNPFLTEHHFDGWSPPKMNPFFQKRWIKNALQKIEDNVELSSLDLIHAHGYVSSFVAADLASELQRPLIISLHHSDIMMEVIPEWREKLLKQVFIQAAVIIVPSKAMAESLKRFKLQDKIEIIPNYIQETEIKFRTKLPSCPEKFICISSLEPLKNIKACIELFEKSEKHLDIYGFGPEEKKWRNYIQKKGLSDRIEIKGRIEHSQLMNIIANYDGMISTSLYETFGISLLESLAAGVPVICLNKYGSRDFINEKNGVFIQDFDRILSRFEDIYHMYDPIEIRTLIVEKYSYRKIVPMYHEIYQELCVE